MAQRDHTADRPILVTGASGYLGSTILKVANENGIPCRGIKIPPAHEKIKAMLPEDSVVIHCAAYVPHSPEEADEYTAEMATRSCELLSRVIQARPVFIVFPSTAEHKGLYAQGKQRAERTLEANQQRYAILRFPGLFGPPRRNGLVYTAARHTLAGEQMHYVPFFDVPNDWTTMHVRTAARDCLAYARDQIHCPHPITMTDPLIDEFLNFVRSE